MLSEIGDSRNQSIPCLAASLPVRPLADSSASASWRRNAFSQSAFFFVSFLFVPKKK